jgi:hypothetical protein
MRLSRGLYTKSLLQFRPVFLEASTEATSEVRTSVASVENPRITLWNRKRDCVYRAFITSFIF